MINLLPPHLKETRIYGRKNLSLIGYSSALLATAVLTAGIILLSLQFISSEEPTLRTSLGVKQTQITELEKEIKKIESTATRLETASKISGQSVKFSELIPQIGAILPDGVVLNALSLAGGSTDPLQLDVDLLNATLAPVMVRNLVESGVFEAADITSLTPKGSGSDEDSSSVYQFTASITASFTGTADAAKKAAAQEAAKKAAAQEASAAAGEQ